MFENNIFSSLIACMAGIWSYAQKSPANIDGFTFAKSTFGSKSIISRSKSGVNQADTQTTKDRAFSSKLRAISWLTY